MLCPFCGLSELHYILCRGELTDDPAEIMTKHGEMVYYLPPLEEGAMSVKH